MVPKTGEKCKVSIIIPFYNSGEWLRECLSSASSQTLKDIEIICVNDGSTDRSADIVSEHAEKDNRIVIVNQENKGVSEARNRGIETASGKYLFFLDSDDILSSDAVETLYKKMEERELELLVFNVRAVSDNSEFEKKTSKLNATYYERELDESKECSGVEFLAYLTEESSYVATVYTMMMLRKFVDDCGLRFIPGILHEDEAFVFEAFLKACKVGCANRYLYQRRLREGSIMTRETRFVNVYGSYRVCKRIEALIKKADIPEHCIGSVFKHLSRLEKNAIEKYLSCSKEEKEKVADLPIAERAELETFLLYPSRIEANLRRTRKENAELKRRLSELQKEKKPATQKIARRIKRMLSRD